jgi:transcriptional regulator with XRE-family HTH domain
LRRLRTEQRLSLSKLAELVFYSKGYLSKVENGEKPPTLDLATQCDEVLGAGGNLVRLVPQGRRRPDGGGGLKRSVHQPLLLAPFQAPLPEF